MAGTDGDDEIAYDERRDVERGGLGVEWAIRRTPRVGEGRVELVDDVACPRQQSAARGCEAHTATLPLEQGLAGGGWWSEVVDVLLGSTRHDFRAE